MRRDCWESSSIRVKDSRTTTGPAVTVSDDKGVHVQNSPTSSLKEIRDKDPYLTVCVSIVFSKLCVAVLLVCTWYFLENNSLTLISGKGKQNNIVGITFNFSADKQ